MNLSTQTNENLANAIHFSHLYFKPTFTNRLFDKRAVCIGYALSALITFYVGYWEWIVGREEGIRKGWDLVKVSGVEIGPLIVFCDVVGLVAVVEGEVWEEKKRARARKEEEKLVGNEKSVRGVLGDVKFEDANVGGLLSVSKGEGDGDVEKGMGV